MTYAGAYSVKSLILAEAASVASGMYNLDAASVANYMTALAWIESRFNPNAHAPSPSTARGLFQINRATQRDAEKLLGVTDSGDELIYDPQYNARLACVIFCARFVKCSRNVSHAVVAYNRGNCKVTSRIKGFTYLESWKRAMKELASLGIIGQNQGVVNKLSFY